MGGLSDARRGAGAGAVTIPSMTATFDDEGPGEHDAHLLDHDLGENDTVACASCGRTVLAFAERCPHCGHDYRSEAWCEPGADGKSRLWLWVAAGLAAVLVLLVIGGVW